MPNEDGTLNNTDTGAGESSDPEHYSEELVSTVELSQERDTSSEGTLNTEDPKDGDEKGGKADEGAAKAGDETGTKEDKGTEGGEDDTKRFDQHPRFKELETQRDENFQRAAKAEARAEALEARIANLEKGSKDEGAETPAAPDYKDTSQMSDEDLLDWQESDPKGYAANLARQIRAEVMKDLSGTSFKPEDVKKTVEEILDDRSKESRVNQTYTKFTEDHSDFNEMWDSGKIKQFMESNPGHNAISAYYELNKDDSSADIDKRIENARKEEREKVAAEFRAKRGAATLGDGPSGAATVSEVPADFKDPKKFGGATNVLVNSLRRFRQGRGS